MKKSKKRHVPKYTGKEGVARRLVWYRYAYFSALISVCVFTFAFYSPSLGVNLTSEIGIVLIFAGAYVYPMLLFLFKTRKSNMKKQADIIMGVINNDDKDSTW